jgi:hypothetical protein
LGGVDITYLPTITVCKLDPASGLPTNACKTTPDLGQALIDGKFDHVGKIKERIPRGLSARFIFPQRISRNDFGCWAFP